MVELRPSSRVPASAAGIPPPPPPAVDLRLDGNQGRAPSADFAAALPLAEELLRSYPQGDALEQALARRHGTTPDRVFLGAGADDVLDRLCRAVLEPGRAAIVPAPTFEMLERYAALAGATLVSPPWTQGAWPRDQVLAAMSPAVALVAIVSPNNPTGLVATVDDLLAVGRAAPHAVVLVDAAYAEFGGEDLTTAALGLPNAVVVRTFSKAFGLAGLRVGYAIAPPAVVPWLRRVGSPFTCGTVARAMALHRLEHGGGEVAAYVQDVARERDALARHLRRLGLEPLPSAGNFVFVRGGDPEWLHDALAGLGIAVRATAGGLRITLPAAPSAFARLVGALDAAAAPAALLFDLDGVLADLEARTPIARPADLAALSASWPLGVVTSCPRRLAESVLQRHGFAPHLRAVVAAEDGPGKPSPAPVRLALQRLGAASAWLLGDNPVDVQAARAAGVVPLAVEPRGPGAEAHAARLRAAGAARLLPGVPGLLALAQRSRSCR
ncbi:MAG: aminotransferase class I/II-fold pyridoxal phosphate-dependent enzyme [Planctomycetes bacterium]|nr:aminotransferase class I/II-fold pyridoxal phosphate-dependent enzyme [Planctomycetota bacterium]